MEERHGHVVDECLECTLHAMREGTTIMLPFETLKSCPQSVARIEVGREITNA